MMLHHGEATTNHGLTIADSMSVDQKPGAFLHSGSSSGDERIGSTERSSTSPTSHVDEIMQDIEDEPAPNDDKTTHEERIEGLESKFLYIQHQLSRLMRQMHVSPCLCETCSQVHKTVNGARQLNEPSQMLAGLFPNASQQQIETLVELSRMNKLPSQVVQQNQTNGHQNSHHQQQQQQQLQHVQNGGSHGKNHVGSGYGAHTGGGKMMIDHRDKKVVSEFARIHGGAAAAKKFGMPPPVSTYYQRKESSNSLVPTTPLSGGIVHQFSLPNVSSANASPGPSSDGGDRDELSATPSNADVVVPQTTTTTTPSVVSTPQQQPTTPVFTQSMVDMLKMNNAAHSTGSPGFLRGRGRGRPKLIGDELDADLVDYMVTVKATDPHGHLTASQALTIAKQYILERAPGLLEEHGGHVKLKLTWAMKLVSRISERQKEMELGLPAGTLSNMGRHQLNNLPGGNFMADMMAQNIISQHMMMVNQMATSGGSQTNKEAEKSNEENMGNAATAPEIVNVKELNIPFLNSLLAEINEKNNGIVDGEIHSDDVSNDDDGELKLGRV